MIFHCHPGIPLHRANLVEGTWLLFRCVVAIECQTSRCRYTDNFYKVAALFKPLQSSFWSISKVWKMESIFFFFFLVCGNRLQDNNAEYLLISWECSAAECCINIALSSPSLNCFPPSFLFGSFRGREEACQLHSLHFWVELLLTLQGSLSSVAALESSTRIQLIVQGTSAKLPAAVADSVPVLHC